MFTHERVDVLCVEFVAVHHSEQPVLLAPPMGLQLLSHRGQVFPSQVYLTAVQRPHRLATMVQRPLVLDDVVTQQRHIPASAVVAHD